MLAITDVGQAAHMRQFQIVKVLLPLGYHALRFISGEQDAIRVFHFDLCAIIHLQEESSERCFIPGIEDGLCFHGFFYPGSRPVGYSCRTIQESQDSLDLSICKRPVLHLLSGRATGSACIRRG